MANSRVAIMNLALQLLGAARVGAPDEDTTNAIETNACYDILRDYEQRANAWTFTKKRKILAPHGVAPAFEFAYAFPLPPDCLRWIKPINEGRDWTIESHAGSTAILTNDGTAIYLKYLGRIDDENKFDPNFTYMLACAIAWHCCERITQSNSKKDAIAARYKVARLEARKMNAFEVIAADQPVDDWILSLQSGQLADASWRRW